MILTADLSFVNGFRGKWVRLYRLIRWCWGWMVQWTGVTVCTGLLKNPNILVHKAVNLSKLSVKCGVLSRGVVGPFLFEGKRVTVLHTSTCFKNPMSPLFIRWMEMTTCTNKTGQIPLPSPSHYHHDVRAYLDNTFPDRQIGHRGSDESPHNFTWLFLVGSLEWRSVHNKASNNFGGHLSVRCSLLSNMSQS